MTEFKLLKDMLDVLKPGDYVISDKEDHLFKISNINLAATNPLIINRIIDGGKVMCRNYLEHYYFYNGYLFYRKLTVDEVMFYLLRTL